MKIIITDDRVEIYREGLPYGDSPGNSCREFAEWAMQWGIKRLATETAAGIAVPGTQRSQLCD
jgi:hypothetical protein